MKAAKNVATVVGFDPTIILAILSAAIQIWTQCHDKKDLPGTVLNRLYRRRLARIIRNHGAPPETLNAICEELKTVKLEDLDE